VPLAGRGVSTARAEKNLLGFRACIFQHVSLASGREVFSYCGADPSKEQSKKAAVVPYSPALKKRLFWFDLIRYGLKAQAGRPHRPQTHHQLRSAISSRGLYMPRAWPFVTTQVPGQKLQIGPSTGCRLALAQVVAAAAMRNALFLVHYGPDCSDDCSQEGGKERESREAIPTPERPNHGHLFSMMKTTKTASPL
jgi:hypothetical protein